MMDNNLRAQRRAALWERLCRLSDELQELAWLWFEEDPEMAVWDTELDCEGDEPTRDDGTSPTTARGGKGARLR